MYTNLSKRYISEVSIEVVLSSRFVRKCILFYKRVQLKATTLDLEYGLCSWLEFLVNINIIICLRL